MLSICRPLWQRTKSSEVDFIRGHSRRSFAKTRYGGNTGMESSTLPMLFRRSFCSCGRMCSFICASTAATAASRTSFVLFSNTLIKRAPEVMRLVSRHKRPSSSYRRHSGTGMVVFARIKSRVAASFLNRSFDQYGAIILPEERRYSAGRSSFLVTVSVLMINQ